MEALIATGILILGFVILIFGGESLVRAAVSTALRFKIRPGVIGLTVIAAGTSAPEAFTSVTAAVKDAADIALGNVIGSNLFNLLAVVGLASLVKANKIENQTARIEWPFLLVASLILIGFGWDLEFLRFEGLIMLLILAVFLIYVLVEAKKAGLEEFADKEDIKKLQSPWQELLFFALGFGGLTVGAYMVLEGGVTLGRIVGLSERVIGITIISVGTGLPELVTSIIAAKKGQNDIAVANVIGSNILNTLGVVGLAAGIMPIEVSPTLIHGDSFWMVLATLMFFPLMFKRVISRLAGGILTSLYIAFIVYLVLVK